jgi:hypothetical protein
MAEIASQGRVGEQGGGEAVVFDTSQFFQNVYNMQKDLYARQEKKKREIDQQNATWNAFLEDMPDVWESDYEYVNKALNEYNDYIIDLKTQGLDPEALDPTIMKKIKQLQNNVAKETSRAKNNEDYSVKATQTFNGDKTNAYNKDHATQWFKEYTDPNKTPEQRAKMRAESSPFKYNYTMDEFIDETIPDEVYTDTGRTKTIYRDKDSHKAIIFDNITNTDIGKDIYETLKIANETPEQFTERVAELGQKKYGVKKDVQPPPSRGGGGSGGGGGKKEKKEPNVTYGKDSGADWDSSLVANKIMLQEKPAVGVKDLNGNTIKGFVPAYGFYIKPGGSVTAKGYGTDVDGTQIDVDVDYNSNMQAFNTEGYPDIFGLFRNQPSAGKSTGGGTTSPNASKGKTYTGVPQGGF